MPIPIKKQQGFTLLELLIVVSIMAIIAGMGLMSHKKTQDYSKEKAIHTEMRELQQAIIHFFKDQNSYTAASPADIEFLLSSNSNSNEVWNPDYRTGWRGPYIKVGDYSTPFVSIADSSNTGLELNGNGSPDAGSVIGVRAKPDPYSHISIGNYFIWSKQNQALSVSNPEIPRLGRPYLFFDLDTYGSEESKARIVSLGIDGVYDISAEISCDLAMTNVNDSTYCSREEVCESLGDDVVLCI